jgi:hypothetical protein
MEVVGIPDVGGLQLLVSFRWKVYSWIKRGERLTYQKPATDKLGKTLKMGRTVGRRPTLRLN